SKSPLSLSLPLSFFLINSQFHLTPSAAAVDFSAVPCRRMDPQTQPLPQPPPSSAPPLSAAVSAVTPTSGGLPAAATAAAAYQDSADSSPRSRSSFYDEQQPPKPQSSKLRLMCSYGGRIVPRPHDKSLCYVGGDTRIVVVDRSASLSGLSSKLSTTLLNGHPFTLKYQLPSEDLDSLISVTTDEDLDNMIDEYDRTSSTNSSKPSRLRLFLFPVMKSDSSQSIGTIVENSAAKDEWFLSALNGAAAAGLLNRGFSESASVNCLLGLDDDPNVHLNFVGIGGGNGNCGGGGVRDGEGLNKNAKLGQDIHSVPDSPMMDTTSSSFGSTSSSPSLANLPPIRVHVAQDQQKAGMEEQFAQISLGGGVVQKPEEGYMVISSPPPMPVSIADDERSEQGVPVGYRRPPPAQSQPQMPPPLTQQPKSNGGGCDLASPDSISRQMPGISQEQQVMQVPPGANRAVTPNLVEPNNHVQVQDSGNLLPAQFEHQQQQQFVHSGAQYIQHHPSRAVPIPAYYPVYTHQQQLHQQQQQYPAVYYVQPRHPQAYNLPVQVQQSSISDPANNTTTTRSQAPEMVAQSAAYNNPTRSTNTPVQQPEMLPAGMYRTSTPGTQPQLVTLSPAQHHHQQQQQFVGYSQVHHHPSQSPASTANPNYPFEFVDPGHNQIYYTQPLKPTMPSQYQTMASGLVLPEGTTQLPAEPIKQQQHQMRTSQPI
ncbi:hypothetical protein LINPERHAP2_LOCUS18265, partial [Linum perenne]